MSMASGRRKFDIGRKLDSLAVPHSAELSQEPPSTSVRLSHIKHIQQLAEI